MVSNLHSRWTVAAVTFVLWALVAASAVYWGLKFSQPCRRGRHRARAAARCHGRPCGGRAPARRDARGGRAPTPSLSSRFALVGVVASRSHKGAALIAVDGRPPKPYRVGAAVDEGLVLQSVDARRAVLAASADGPPSVTLELPTLRK